MFQNTCLLGVANLLTKLLSFVTLPLFTAWLAPDAFGTVDALVTTALLLLPLATLGAPETIFRFLAAGERPSGEVLFGALCLCLVGGSVTLFLLPLFGGLLGGYLLHLAGYVAASAARSLFVHILRAEGRYTALALQQIFCALLTVLLQITFLRAGLGVRGYLLGVICGDGGTALVLLLLLAGRLFRVKITPNRATLREMRRYALPLVPTAALWWLAAALDRYVLLHRHGAAAVGLLAAAAKLPTLLGLATAIFLEAWHFTAAKTEKEARDALFGRIFRLLLPFALLAATGLMLVGRPLFSLLFADDYGIAVVYLPYLVLAALFSALAQFLGSAYTANMLSTPALLTAALGVAVNFLLAFLLIPPLGVLGAALATLVAHAAFFLVRLLHVGRRFVRLRHALLLALSVSVLLAAAILAQQAPWQAVALALLAPLPFLPLLWQGIRFFLHRVGVFFLSFKKHQ